MSDTLHITYERDPYLVTRPLPSPPVGGQNPAPDRAAPGRQRTGGSQRLSCSEAAFAHLCGVAPIPASSGKTVRHRLDRGGNRDANRALHLLAVRRLAWDPRTRAYATRRTAEGKTTPEILRCLKR